MKQGRFLKLVNSTPYEWVMTDSHSFEMITWNLPDSIKSDTTATVYVEWEPGLIHYTGDNIGVSTYHLEGTTDTFQVQARGDENSVILVIYCENLSTKETLKGDTVPLDLSPEGYAVFILSGVHGNYYLIDVDDSGSIKEVMPSEGDTEVIRGVGLLETVNNVKNAYWEAETKNVININKLHFPGDKKWEACLVEVRGTKRIQSFSIIIKTDDVIIAKEEFSLRKDEIRVMERRIDKVCSIEVEGQLRNNSSLKAGGSIQVTCIYNPSEQFDSETIRWGGITDETSCIDNLCLYGTQAWEKCEIYIEGYENKNTGCMLTLISNGEIHKDGRIGWIELKDTQSRTFSFEIKKKVPLVVAGYISNTAITGAGANITLTGFYKGTLGN
ncbi:MAG: hypothetical protein WCD89_05505 [Anaerocolumna sp.]